MSDSAGQLDSAASVLQESARTVEVFADVVCPFTHVGLRRLFTERDRRGATGVSIRVRAWPLELVNGAPPGPQLLVEEIAALRGQVSPDMFMGFSEAAAPTSTMAALALGCAAYAHGHKVGEQVAVAIREALFEEGRSLEDLDLLRSIAATHGIDPGCIYDIDRVRADFEEGSERGVIGSPHFFVSGTERGERGWFCPGLDISHTTEGFSIRLATHEFEEFLDSCFK